MSSNRPLGGLQNDEGQKKRLRSEAWSLPALRDKLENLTRHQAASSTSSVRVASEACQTLHSSGPAHTEDELVLVQRAASAVGVDQAWSYTKFLTSLFELDTVAALRSNQWHQKTRRLGSQDRCCAFEVVAWASRSVILSAHIRGRNSISVYDIETLYGNPIADEALLLTQAFPRETEKICESHSSLWVFLKMRDTWPAWMQDVTPQQDSCANNLWDAHENCWRTDWYATQAYWDFWKHMLKCHLPLGLASQPSAPGKRFLLNQFFIDYEVKDLVELVVAKSQQWKEWPVDMECLTRVSIEKNWCLDCYQNVVWLVRGSNLQMPKWWKKAGPLPTSRPSKT